MNRTLMLAIGIGMGRWTHRGPYPQGRPDERRVQGSVSIRRARSSYPLHRTVTT